jgi:hypothetical protein
LKVFSGIPVVESPFVPEGKAFVLSAELYRQLRAIEMGAEFDEKELRRALGAKQAPGIVITNIGAAGKE